jgi:hypothetical protein
MWMGNLLTWWSNTIPMFQNFISLKNGIPGFAYGLLKRTNALANVLSGLLKEMQDLLKNE